MRKQLGELESRKVLVGTRELTQAIANAHKEMLERQRVQEEALTTLREERQQMQQSMETNGRVLGEQIRDAQAQTLAQTQPLLLSILAKLGIEQPEAGSAAGSRR